ncbi:MAG: glycosyltransferase family 39 protein [Clostridia bacterium]|nr:glycosyltransferase family 39 protein [Clostridia bacterium]
MKKRLNALGIVLILIFSFMIRYYAIHHYEYILTYDALNYHNMAKQFLSDGILGYKADFPSGEPNAYITPGYPLFLAAIYAVSPDENAGIYHVKIVQAFLGTLTALIAYFIAKRLGGGLAGWIALILMAIYPTYIVMPLFLLTEPLYTFLFLGYVYLQLVSFEKKKPFLYLLTGLLFGLAVMVRPGVFFAAFFIYLFYCLAYKEKGKFKNVAAFFAGLLIVMVPWWIRNCMVLNEFILLCTQGGNPLLGGAYPPELAPKRYPQENQFEEGIHVIVNGFKTQFSEYIAWFTLGKMERIFREIYLLYIIPQLKYVWFTHGLILSGGVMGLVYGCFHKKTGFIALLAILLTVFHLFVIPENRYAYAILPLFIILFGCLMSAAVKEGKGKL